MGHVPGSFGWVTRSRGSVATVWAWEALRPRLGRFRAARGGLDRLRGWRLLGDPLRRLSRQRDIRPAFREIDDLRESVTASFRRRAVVGFSVRSRIRPRHHERVQAGACFGIEIATQVPTTGALLTQPELASLKLGTVILFGVPVRV